MFGGDSVIISGMSIRENDRVVCTFDKTQVEGLYIEENLAVCISPPARTEAVVELKIDVVRETHNITGGALYQYSKLSHYVHNKVNFTLFCSHSITRTN